jgi:hypothetical protein
LFVSECAFAVVLVVPAVIFHSSWPEELVLSSIISGLPLFLYSKRYVSFDQSDSFTHIETEDEFGGKCNLPFEAFSEIKLLAVAPLRNSHEYPGL